VGQLEKETSMTKRETIVTFIKDMLRPRTLREIIDIEMRDALLSKMQAEKSLEYATSVVDYNRQRIRRLQEKLLELGDKDA
jgi:DNA-directed RNA polymerase subunit F